MVFAVALGGWLYFGANRLDGIYQHQAADKAKEYRDSARVRVQARCAALPRAEIRACVYQEYYAARQGEHDEYDLQAQLVTSAWTRAMGIAAIIGMAVGILGVGLIYKTFEETRRGAAAARDANEIAERTAQVTLAAYRDQIAASRPLMKLVTEETRFEVPPFGDVWDDPKHGLQKAIRPIAEIKNVGSQPCWIESVWMGIFVMVPFEGRVDWPEIIGDQFRQARAGFVDQGETVKIGGGFWRIPEFQFDLIGHGGAVMCYGMCQYRSLAQHLFTTRFAYYLNRNQNVLTPGMPLDIPSHWRDGRVERAKRAVEDPIEWIE